MDKEMTMKLSQARIESLRKYLADLAKGIDTVKAFNEHKERMKVAALNQAK